jgi:hypothetical protein
VINRPIPAPGVVVEDLDDDVCLYRSDIDEVLVLNRSAGDIWRLADGGRSVETIATRLADVYRTDHETVRTDVQAVVADLVARGYLVEQSEV